MEEVAACEASNRNGRIPKVEGPSLVAGEATARRDKRKETAVKQPERTEEEEEDLKRKMEEYIRLSSMAPDVEVVEEEEGLPPYADEGPVTVSGIDIVAAIGMKGEKAKAEARRAMEAYLAEQSTSERLKEIESVANRSKAEEPNEDDRKQLDLEDKDNLDCKEWMATRFRDGWAESWSRQYGSYEDTSELSINSSFLIYINLFVQLVRKCFIYQ